MNRLETKISLHGEEILYIGGQINHYISAHAPRFPVLIIQVRNKNGIISPYSKFDTPSLSEFVDKIYELKDSLDKKLGDNRYEIQMNFIGSEGVSD